MSNLMYARVDMGISLAFHIIFASVGIALPLFMVIADALYLRTGDRDYLELSRRMAKGTAIFFAVGAVSGTVLSFELGLLWPSFMGTFGEVIGLPFGLEGIAFFTEAIFLGIYLYGRGKISNLSHLLSGVLVAVSGALSAFFVTLVNAFMNLPSGFRMAGGVIVDVDPLAAMWSAPWKHETLHVLLSAYEATAFAVVGIHAVFLLRRPASQIFRKGLAIVLAVACVTALLQPLSGHHSAQSIAREEPLKLAAIEGHFETSRGAPIQVLGLPDPEARTVRYAITIPKGLSLLSFNDPDAEVQGLEAFPRDEWPNLTLVHGAFDVMVGAGSALALLAVVVGAIAIKKRGLPDSRNILYALVAASPLGLVALEAGWFVTELGRQPWIVRGAMRTKDAVTPFPHIAAPFWLFAIVYVLLGVTVVYLLMRQLRAAPDKAPPSSVGDLGHAH